MIAVLLLLLSSAGFAQKKYPSVFWEITGNGLKKPSYLFGTMHVSSKLAFHLSDSFYHALRRSDVVALELNPQDWQRDMFRMEDAQVDLQQYMSRGLNGYLRKSTFSLDKYEKQLMYALKEQPQVVNSLLYRNYQSMADYEENTYLDLYIYQTGRRLGKQPAGVENLFETERLIMEGYADQQKEKNKKKRDFDESMYAINEKVQDAYRRGDLDLMDSLDALTIESEAFNEKFLYKRNEIQANSMDTIMQRRGLFVGVGAAHLPGPRGVIELLRKKGYTLRPISMLNRDAVQRDTVDKIHVPVTFRQVKTDDGLVSMLLPGALYKRRDAVYEAWQYADMENGVYYMLSRVPTQAAMMGQPVRVVLNKIDSLLYENIPGKILKKTAIVNNGYSGFDITNRTRRGDIQRYNIFVTPFEVLVFKMSGNDDYVSGREAQQFFASIRLERPAMQQAVLQDSSKGFAIRFPQAPVVSAASGRSGGNGWNYYAADSASGNSYTLSIRTIANDDFLEEDTFNLSLVEESIRSSDFISREKSRQLTRLNGYAALDMQFVMSDSSLYLARAVTKGTHYYVAAARAGNEAQATQFLQSLQLTDFTYGPLKRYTDTFLRFTVQTPVVPAMDAELRTLVEQMQKQQRLYADANTTYSSYGNSSYASFTNDSSGESVSIVKKEFPEYYTARDSAWFWKREFFPEDGADDTPDQEEDDEDDASYTAYTGGGTGQNKMVVENRRFFRIGGYPAASYELSDTNTVSRIYVTGVLQDNIFWTLTAQKDSLSRSAFLDAFFTSFIPVPDGRKCPSVFDDKIDSFFADFNSADSVTRKRARSAIRYIYFKGGHVDKLKAFIAQLKFGEKDYFSLKSDLIEELGYIRDASQKKNITAYLKELYETAGDTAYFQNAVLKALSRQRTKEATLLLKDLLLSDPPLFTESYAYGSLFSRLRDTGQLARLLFPDILQLTALDDYRQPVTGLLVQLLDSGYIQRKDYSEYFSRLYFDAKIELKKQQNKDEKALESEMNKDGDESDASAGYSSSSYLRRRGGRGMTVTDIDRYSTLLMPFYDKNKAIPKFFERLLASRDDEVKTKTAVLLLKNNKPVPDTLMDYLAAKDAYRAALYARLKSINKTGVFPAQYVLQPEMARSLLLASIGKEKFAAVELYGKQLVNFKGHQGYLYLFKYKINKDDGWRIGLSGLQPVDETKVNAKTGLVRAESKKITTEKPEAVQFEESVRRLLFSRRPAARMFYSGNSNTTYTSYNE